MREGRRRADHDPGSLQNPTRKPGHAARELDIGPVERDDQRFPGRERDRARGKPVRVHEVRVARRRSRSARKRSQHGRNEERKPRACAEIGDDPRPVRNSEVTEPIRRDDVYVDSALAQALDRVAEKRRGVVAGIARVRRRQDGDLHAEPSRGANATGAAAGIGANASMRPNASEL